MPAFRGHFSVQGSAVGGLSYKVKKTAGLSIRQYLLWKIAHSALAAAFMAVLTGILGFHFF